VEWVVVVVVRQRRDEIVVLFCFTLIAEAFASPFFEVESPATSSQFALPPRSHLNPPILPPNPHPSSSNLAAAVERHVNPCCGVGLHLGLDPTISHLQARPDADHGRPP